MVSILICPVGCIHGGDGGRCISVAGIVYDGWMVGWHRLLGEKPSLSDIWKLVVGDTSKINQSHTVNNSDQQIPEICDSCLFH